MEFPRKGYNNLMPRGEGYLRKRGNVWYFEFMYHGRRYYHRIGAVSKTVAREIANDLRAKIIRGEYLPPREENLTFRELADTFQRERSLGYIRGRYPGYPTTGLRQGR